MGSLRQVVLNCQFIFHSMHCRVFPKCKSQSSRIRSLFNLATWIT
uniref:Uncharacterized protein n=1 Tax=Rhizophora mucronata TaxID=61149 RepID=A0A2P2NHF7_RHIMU